MILKHVLVKNNNFKFKKNSVLNYPKTCVSKKKMKKNSSDLNYLKK